jgi:hypothetical protein
LPLIVRVSDSPRIGTAPPNTFGRSLVICTEKISPALYVPLVAQVPAVLEQAVTMKVGFGRKNWLASCLPLVSQLLLLLVKSQVTALLFELLEIQ